MGSEAPPMAPPTGDSSPARSLPLDGSAVKMKGLPFKANVDDVVKFYQGFSLGASSVYLKRHPDGRLNGEAFVVFENPDEARRACQKDRETFGDKWGDRYVRVYPTLESDVSDMQQAVQQQNMGPQQGGHGHHLDSVVKMKSLPFDATQLDIITFFEGFRLKPNGVQLVVRSDNKPTGEAFVDFEAPDEAARALREKDHKVFHDKFGDRYVRLIQVSRKEMQATLALRFGGEGILKVKGIPFKAAANDVRKFFSGYKIKPDGGGMGGMNAAMSMLQSLLSNPANLSLMMAQSPWMAQHLLASMGAAPPAGPHGGPHLGHGMPPAGAPPGSMPPVDHGALAAAAQFGQQLGAAGMGNIAGALNGLSLGQLHPSQQQGGGPQGPQGGPHGMQQHSPPGDVGNGWMPNAPQDNMVFYGNAAGGNGMERAWGDHR
ncbi:heterogeneous nuclear ribonucleoprotein H2 [Raphidocelis subcapitata]|uniref:Heterogeneous nuclear ribonucleoprotein H2 n=1 Tax=Raphidocelis subcapitata TaxID=307507 RepID=A0A2V0P596_9CHLO|nr:heterogeneous nuclear ribonucleoprotein H2 [Raphidocelis subcapitata]|eukprot:GBF94749.1 heterogeneous nuclear ribonucleoprotein H2 [Raphidocelis subcapitata]